MEASNPQMVKKQNLAFLMTLLYGQDRLTQKEIAEMSGLSVVTINKLLPELVASKQIVEQGEGTATGGRPALIYGYNARYQLLLVIQLIAEDEQFIIRFYLSDLLGEIIHHEKHLGSALSWVGIKDLISDLIVRYPNIGAIAFGIPGIEREGVPQIVVFPQLLHVNLAKEIKEAFNLPVLIENDMNAAVFGAASTRGHVSETVVGLYYPNSFPPGAGVYLQGHLLKGRNNFIGEISYLPLVAENQWNQVPVKAIDLVNNLRQVIQTFICLYDPHKILIFTNNHQLDLAALESIKEKLTDSLPMVDLPELYFWPQFKEDYLQGLIAQGLALIQ